MQAHNDRYTTRGSKLHALPRVACALRRAASVLMMAWVAASSAGAANLTIGDGVVVKFGQDAGITVRDAIQTGQRVIFTSAKDDATLGQTGSAAQTPVAGDWRGLKLEASASAAAVSFTDLTVRFAGGQSGAALDLRKNAFAVPFLFVSDSVTGLRVTDGSIASFSGASVINNQVGIEVNRGATPSITRSEIRGNVTFGINNKTPATVVQATNNWWGSLSGPNDPINNPQGTGDKVSTGVNYGQYTVQTPLLDCGVAAADGNYVVTQQQVTLALACRNAIEFRLSATTDFTGINFSPFVAQSVFTLPAGSGAKQVYAEYRSPSGNTLVVSLPQAFQLTQSPPTVSITNPAEGAIITGTITISATATDALGVAHIDFSIDGVGVASVNAPPFNYVWNIVAVADGPHTITAVAYNTAGLNAQDTRNVTVQKPPVDTAGPTISNVKFAGAALTAGATITAAGQLTLDVSDPSGVQSVQVKIDGATIAGGNLAGTQYSILLDFNNVANGPHSITITATDLLANVTTLSLNITVAFPQPVAPIITSPSNGVTVKQSPLSVSGTASLGSQVQLYVNGAAAGNLLTVNGNGSFSGTVTLASEGSYTLTADARNSRGTSPKSAPVQITYAVAAPSVVITSPAANATLSTPVDFNVSVADATAINNVVLAIDGAAVATLNAPPYTYHWDINLAADGAHALSAVATNTAGKTGQDSRTVNVQKIPPPPPPIVTPYTGEVSSISPASSYGEQNIVITGRAKDRSTGLSVQNVALKIVLQVAGFQRKITVATDSAGNFSFNFVPQTTDAGAYTVSVIHPDETTLANQGQFVINRLNFSPTSISVNAIKGFAQPITIAATASAGQGAAGVRFQLNAEDQPGSSLPAGISLDTGTAVNVPAGSSVAVTFNFTGSTSAAAVGTVVVTAYAADSGSAKRGTVTLNYRLGDPLPALFSTPTFIQTGTSQGQSVTETLTLENKGLIAATNVTVQLQNGDGSSNVPAWIYLASVNQLGNFEVGQKQTMQVTAAPDASVVNGIYSFKLHVTAGNAAGGDVPLTVSVTQSGVGGVQFKVADIYTSTLDANGQTIPGLAGAAIKVQNADVLTVQQSTTSDATGTATIANLATGTYTWRASAPNHMDASGRFQIKPAVTTPQNVFLDYNAVSVEFTVTPTTIQDHYDVTLTATYQTQVPAPVVLLEPLSINLPDMQVGEEYTGEISLTNYGLVRADHVVFNPPQSDAYFKYELYGTVPTSLEAKQRLTLAYKITSLQALPGAASPNVPRKGAIALRSVIDKALQAVPRAGTANSCNSYGTTVQATYDFTCANGDTRSGGASTAISKMYGSSCGGGGGTTTIGSGGPDAGGFGGVGGGGASPPAMGLTPQCVPPCCASCGCAAGGSGAGGGSGGFGSGFGSSGGRSGDGLLSAP